MTLYFWSFIAVTFVLVGAILVRPERIFEYPYFMAATFAAFISPQAYALLSHADYWPETALETTFLMCLLSIGACWLGYQVQPNQRFLRRIDFPLNSNRLLAGGIFFVLCGFYFSHLINQLPTEAKGASWSGIVTIYHFFAMLIYLGVGICLYCARKWGNLLAWTFTGVALIVPLEAAIFYGRREPTALIILTIGLVFYFVDGLKPPRWAAIGAVVAAMLIIPIVGEYRKILRDDPWEAVKQLRPLEALEAFMNPDATLELKNAVYAIAGTQYTGDYQFGKGYWDVLVFRFVPGQLVGSDFKNSLTISGNSNVSASLSETMLVGASFDTPAGSTVTGLGDTYWQFGYLGCLFFAAVAILFKNLWYAANTQKSLAAQLLYIPMITAAMRAVTNWSIDFLPGAIYSSVFVGLVVLFARERAPERPQPVGMERAWTPGRR